MCYNTKMGILKRYEVKYIRDGIKKLYPVKTACEICAATEGLHFHHYNSLAELYNAWSAKHGIKPESAEEMFEVRENFYSEYYEELVNLGACLCKKCHERLHKVYGKNPPIRTATKQAAWVEKQRTKHEAKNLALSS
jgi:hypothetical protein